MEVLYPRCAGLDVHQQTVVACARIVPPFDGPTGGAHLRHGDRRPVGAG